MTFAVEVEGVLGGDAVGAAHAAAAWREVVLVDVSGTHWDKADVDVSDNFCRMRYELKKRPYGGWSSGICLRWCRRLQEETVGTGYLCPEGPLLSETSATPFLPRGTPVETTEGT